LNDRAIRLNQLRKDQDGLIVQKVEEVNALAEQIAALNVQIVNVKASGLQPNDLLDERDRLLDRLAELTGAVSSLQNDGQVIVSIGGHALVVGNTSFSLTTSPDATNNNLAKITWSDGKDFTPPQGELAALLDIRDVHILNQLNGLNSLASTLITQVNSIHQSGYDLNNNTGNLFFDGTDALSIHISISSDELNRIAASANPNTPGDGSIAGQLAALQYQPLLGPNNSLTLNEFYANQIGELGISTQNALSNANAHRLVADNLDSQRESVSGVNLDEEAANLLKTQYAYNAAARLMTVLDEMVDRIINGMGRVGL
jgi:flagellar hook-associated protein 1 FlgK